MKDYVKLSLAPIFVEFEEGILAGSVVKSASVKVEVDEYITIDNEVTFD